MTTEFRELNQREKNTIFAAADKNRIPADDLRISDAENLLVSYERMQGGFTVCVLTLERYGSDLEPQVVIWRGVSRRSYKDKPNAIRGEMLAFSRAILYSRAVTLDGSSEVITPNESESARRDDSEEEYFLVLSLDDRDAPSSLESGQVVEVFSNRRDAESFISDSQSDTRRLEILAVRI